MVGSLIELVRQRVDATEIVEIGGGRCHCLDILGSFAPLAQRTSYDISKEAQAHNALSNANITFIVGDVREGLDHEGGTADFVYSSHLIEHLDEPYDLIEEQLRICKVGGVTAIAAPLHMHHKEHRQVFSIGDMVGMMKSYYLPVICFVDPRETEILVAVTKA